MSPNALLRAVAGVLLPCKFEERPFPEGTLKETSFSLETDSPFLDGLRPGVEAPFILFAVLDIAFSSVT
jgi:hypothetical protein